MPDTSRTNYVADRPMGAQQPEIVLGQVVGIGDTGAPLVGWDGCPGGVAVPALTTAICTVDHVGRTVALLFADGDPSRPIIVGIIQQPLDAVVDATRESAQAEQDSSASADPPAAARTAEIDEETVVLSADKKIVLQCGKASITLTRAGKVIIRGEYVLSRSSGANRVKGASISLN